MRGDSHARLTSLLWIAYFYLNARGFTCTLDIVAANCIFLVMVWADFSALVQSCRLSRKWYMYQDFYPGWTADYNLRYWKDPLRTERDKALVKRVSDYYYKKNRRTKRRKTKENELNLWLIQGACEAFPHATIGSSSGSSSGIRRYDRRLGSFPSQVR